MNETVFDKEMKNMLHRCADELHAPDTMKTRVDFALRSAQVKPRHRWGKRIAVLAAVAAIAVTGAFAAGGLGSITSHSWSDQRLSMEQTQQHMEQAGVAFTLPECIGDFTFSYGYDADTLAESAAGEREQVKEVNAEYEKDGVTYLRGSYLLDVLGKECIFADNRYSFIANGLYFSLGADSQIVDFAEHKMNSAPVMADGDIFLPVIETCTLMGYTAEYNSIRNIVGISSNQSSNNL